MIHQAGPDPEGKSLRVQRYQDIAGKITSGVAIILTFTAAAVLLNRLRRRLKDPA